MRAWHHSDLTAVLTAGTPVRLHEQLHALGGPFGWCNLIISEGVGPVETPLDTARWADQVTGGVVSLQTGRGVPLDHPAPESDDEDIRPGINQGES